MEQLIKILRRVHECNGLPSVERYAVWDAIKYLTRYAEIEKLAEEFGYSDGEIDDFCHFASQVMNVLNKE